MFLIFTILIPLSTLSFSGFIFPLAENKSIFNPVGGTYLTYIGHLGEDYVIESGNDVLSIADGVVVRSFDWPLCDEYQLVNGKKTKITNSHGWGGVVIVEHTSPDGLFFDSDGSILTLPTEENPKVVYSLYGHLTDVSVKVGDIVKAGDLVGKIANMCLYSPHLHIEAKDKNAFREDILDGVGKGYSGVSGYAPHRYKPSKFIELNKNLITEEKLVELPVAKSESTFVSLFKNPFDTFLNFFTKKDDQEIKGEKVEVDGEIKEEIKKDEKDKTQFNAQILNKNESYKVLPGQVIKLQISAKNTGASAWFKKNVSVNVVGGETTNTQYKHSSWLTDLRTTLLNQSEIKNGETGTFSFIITAPQTFGNYKFKSFLVSQNGYTFTSIGTDVYTANLEVVESLDEKKEKIIEPSDTVTDVLEDTIKKGTEKVEKIVDNVIDSIKKIPEYIDSKINFSSGGGSGGSSSPSVETKKLVDEKKKDENEVEPKEEVVEKSLDIWITITSPMSSSTYTNASSTTISGEKGSDVDVIFVGNIEIDMSTATTNTWQYEANLAEGDNDFIFSVHDTAGVATSTVQFKIIRDSNAPSIPQVTATQQTFASPTMFISWGSLDVEEVYYDVEMKLADSENWNSLFVATTNTYYIVDVLRYNAYQIRARAQDLLGNYSDWSEAISLTVDWPKTLVLNEFSWIGVGSSSQSCKYPEWMELYNTTEDILTVDGWSILVESKDNTFTIPLLGEVKSHAYYLVENIEKVINMLPADALFPSSKSLPDTGARIVILNEAGDIIDEIDQKNGWVAGGKIGDKYLPVERVDVKVPGIFASNWINAQSLRYGILSGCRNPVYGSPKQTNGHYWFLPQNITQVYDFGEAKELILGIDHSPYIFDTQVTIPVGYTLRVEPGVILVGAGNTSGFNVEGVLKLLGTSEHKIIVTSIKDTQHGVWCSDEILSSFCTSQPASGDWQNIRVENGGVLEVNHTEFMYAGAKYTYGTCSTCSTSQVIRNQGGTISLSDSTINMSYAQVYNSKYDAYVYTDGGMTSVENTLFSGGCRAIYGYNNANFSMSGSLVENFNSGCVYPIELQSIKPSQWMNNQFVENTNNATYLGALTIDSDFSFDPNNIFVLSDTDVVASSTLTLLPGTQLIMTLNSTLQVDGSLSAQGSEDSPIYIHGISGNEFGGIFVNGGNANLSNVVIENGGRFKNIPSYPIQSNESAVLWLLNAQANLDDVSLLNSRRPGGNIYAENSTIYIQDSTIGWDEGYEKLTGWYDNGIILRGSSLFLNNVDFKKTDFVVKALDLSTVTSENFGVNNFIEPYNISPYKNWFPVDLFDFELWGMEENIFENESVGEGEEI